MKIAVFAAALATVMGVTGCALVPVQDMTLRNDQGGSITCKQVGAGLVSYEVGKARFEECVAKARAQGYK